MHCEEDLSLGEIAQEAGISRQAVHDVLVRTAQKLFDLEKRMGLAHRFRRASLALRKNIFKSGISANAKEQNASNLARHFQKRKKTAFCRVAVFLPGICAGRRANRPGGHGTGAHP